MESHGEVGAALTKTGHVGTSRRCGSGEQDETPYERNQCLMPRNCSTGSNLEDMGRLQRTPSFLVVATSKPIPRCRWGGHAECLRRRRGDAAGVELDGSLVDRMVVNVGSVLASPFPPWGGGQVRRRLMRSGRGGGPVVVRAR